MCQAAGLAFHSVSVGWAHHRVFVCPSLFLCQPAQASIKMNMRCAYCCLKHNVLRSYAICHLEIVSLCPALSLSLSCPRPPNQARAMCAGKNAANTYTNKKNSAQNANNIKTKKRFITHSSTAMIRRACANLLPFAPNNGRRKLCPCARQCVLISVSLVLFDLLWLSPVLPLLLGGRIRSEIRSHRCAGSRRNEKVSISMLCHAITRVVAGCTLPNRNARGRHAPNVASRCSLLASQNVICDAEPEFSTSTPHTLSHTHTPRTHSTHTGGHAPLTYRKFLLFQRSGH